MFFAFICHHLPICPWPFPKSAGQFFLMIHSSRVWLVRLHFRFWEWDNYLGVRQHPWLQRLQQFQRFQLWFFKSHLWRTFFFITDIIKSSSCYSVFLISRSASLVQFRRRRWAGSWFEEVWRSQNNSPLLLKFWNSDEQNLPLGCMYAYEVICSL